MSTQKWQGLAGCLEIEWAPKKNIVKFSCASTIKRDVSCILYNAELNNAMEDDDATSLTPSKGRIDVDLSEMLCRDNEN